MKDTITRLATMLLCAAGLAGCGEPRAPALASTSASPSVDDTLSAGNLSADDPNEATLAATDESSSQEQAPAPAQPAGGNIAQASATEIRSGLPARIADISFDDIKFEMLKTEPFRREMLTDKINALDGRPIRIRGYILPSFQQTGLTQFVLVRDNLSCCFGPGAALYDCIVVDMQPGKSTDFSISPVTVEGTFSVRERLDPEGKALAIYHLDGESVR